MKKNIVFMMLLILSTTSFGQQTQLSEKHSRQDYLTKSKHQKTAAWIMLGGGAALATVGVIISSARVYDELGTAFTTGHDDKTFVAGGILAAVGGLSMVGSIPLFIASGKNKRKAMATAFFLEMETMPILHKASTSSLPYLALLLKISLP
jgi:hypothetical protein